MSLLLRLRVPPANLPIDGPPMPRSLLFPDDFDDLKVGFSRMIPFSLASRLLRSSLVAAFSLIPFRWDMGIFSWLNNDVFAPSDCTLRSRALCRFFPVGSRSFADSNRCDSLSSLCKARSFLRSIASSSLAAASSPSFLDVDFAVKGFDRSGGFAF